jgi:hypothetical protein
MVLMLVNFTFYYLLANIENGLKMVLDTETCSLWILEPKNKCVEGLNKYKNTTSYSGAEQSVAKTSEGV